MITASNGSKVDNEVKNMLVLAIWIMYYTGMRPAECFALNRDEIDLDKGEIAIRKQLSIDTSRHGYISNTKTEDSIRVVPICKDLKEYLLDLPDGYLFKRKNGKYLDAKTSSDIIRKVCNNGFHLYQLRHQFATDLINTEGVDIRTIQDLMGHKNSSMTLSYMRTDSKKMNNAVANRKKS